MEIAVLDKDTVLWKKTMAFAGSCSWKAGVLLAQLMKENSLNGWERVLAAVEEGNIVGFCTLTKHDQMPEICGYSPCIGFVFVDVPFRGRRISGSMIDCACRYAGTLGFKAVYICSSEIGLYEKYGFVNIGETETIYGTTELVFCRSIE